MRLQIYSSRGNFNLLDPDEESIVMSVRVFENNEQIKYSSIKVDYEIDENDFDFDSIAEEVANMIEAYQKRLLLSTSREKDLDTAKFLREHKEEIARGNKAYRIEQLEKQRAKIDKELSYLSPEKENKE